MWLFVECLAQRLGEEGFAPTLFRPRFPRVARLVRGRIANMIHRLVLEAAQLRRAAREADLVHVGDHASAFHLLSRSLRRVPKVVTCHDVFFIASCLAPDSHTTRGERWWQRRILDGVANADRIACISPSTETDLASLLRNAGHTSTRTQLVANGLYQIFPVGTEAGLGARLAQIDEHLRPGRYVLHVGGNFARKNRIGVVQAFARFGPARGFRLVLAGEPPDAALRHAITQAGLEAFTTIASHTTRTDLGALYQGAFALLFPSKAEGFGLPPIEAQSLGCPVVCSDIPSHRWILGDSAMLAPADNLALMVSQLEVLLDPISRRQLVQLGRENAERFSQKAMIGRYAALYRELLEP